jgi:hypothetical protein
MLSGETNGDQAKKKLEEVPARFGDFVCEPATALSKGACKSFDGVRLRYFL